MLGLLCRQEGRHDAALRLQQRARKLHERAHGAGHHEVARDASHIGNCLCMLGRFDEAAAAYRDAHAIDLAAHGAEHVHTATDGAALGLVLATQVKPPPRHPCVTLTPPLCHTDTLRLHLR